jgi:anti-sigma regulatory factor (Ser/Thr protein kinase)
MTRTPPDDPEKIRTTSSRTSYAPRDVSAFAPSVDRQGYRHEALFYAGDDAFAAAVEPFVRDGVRAGEPVLVVVSTAKIARLREALGDDADRVTFADMDEVGLNPACIIPAWREFVAEQDGPCRGVGEPISTERGPAELVECHRHEALLNLAFADTPGFWLVCPYDTTALSEHVLHEATRTHPHVVQDDERRASDLFAGDEAIAAPFDDPLPPPAGPFHAQAFDREMLADIRRFVVQEARAAGVPEPRVQDVAVAVSELATNSIRHAGGTGVLRVWSEGEAFLCEIRDRGAISDPLAGRVAPSGTAAEGFGLWLANRLCDLVQVRTFADGGAVRLHVRR